VADERVGEPDPTAVRVALWRAMHVLVDAPPHVLEDEIGLRLADPADGWRDRPDMDPVFLLPLDLIDERDRQGWIISENGARRSGTPFISFFAPAEFLDLARAAGFADVRHVSGRDLNDRYLAGRPDGLRMSTGEDFLVATT
jgi:O-methyltransferase involved in polyketide biosynthesis